MTLSRHSISALVLSFSLSIGLKAAQRTVDNSPNSPGQYTNLQTAASAADPGDTLLITGTNISYGNVIVDRPLTLFGAGYAPNGGATIVDFLYVRSSGVFVTGLQGQVYLDVNGIPGDSIADITVTRCRINSLMFTSEVSLSTYRDIHIRQNVVNFWSFTSCASGPTMNLDSVLFENNIMNSIGMGGNCMVNFSGTETLIMDHNLFIGSSGGCVGGNQQCGVFSDGWGGLAWPSSSSIIRNNIFHMQGIGGVRGCGNCTWFNNITTDTGGNNDSIPGTPLGNNNHWDLTPGTVLVNYPGGNFDWGHDYSPQAGSLAINGASDGTNIGPSGGWYPFVPGTPPQGPYIEYFNVDGSAIEINGDVIINFKAYRRQ